MGLKDKYIQKSKDSWKNKKTWHPLIISLVLVICLAIIHKAYWESTTETNPDEIWNELYSRSFKSGINDLYDMGGNAWEWGLDKRGKERITLGASFWYGPEKTKESGFQFKDKDFHVVYIGFRCVFASVPKNDP